MYSFTVLFLSWERKYNGKQKVLFLNVRALNASPGEGEEIGWRDEKSNKVDDEI